MKPQGYYSKGHGRNRRVIPINASSGRHRMHVASVVSPYPRSNAPDLASLKAARDKKWYEIQDMEKKAHFEHWTPEKEYEERIRIVRQYENELKQPDLKPIVYRTQIGHYGGLYVEVPEEHFEEFKSYWPSREFPREVRTIDVRDENFTFEGEQHFRQRFPNSNRIKQVYFANGTKGEARLDYVDMPHGDLTD